MSKQVRHRKLGNSAIEVAPLAFGGNVFGWTADEATSFSLLDRFVEAGLNLVDTADVYSRWASGNQGGESETVIGKWIKRGGARDKLVIATKVGMDMGAGRVGLSRAYIRRAVEDSLTRLQTDYIDLYQSHTDDQNTPMIRTRRWKKPCKPMASWYRRARYGSSVPPITVPREWSRHARSVARMATRCIRPCSRNTTCMPVPILKANWSNTASRNRLA